MAPWELETERAVWRLRMGQGRFGFLETWCLLYYFPSCYDRTPDKELRKKGFVLAHSLWVQSPHGRDVMAASKGGGSWLQTGSREERMLAPLGSLPFRFVSSLQPWVCGPVLPHLGAGLPPQLDSGTALTDTPTALSPALFYFLNMF